MHPQFWPEDLDYARQARRGDRLGGDGDDDRAGDGGRRRARHDAAALAHVRRRPARPRQDRQPAPPAAARHASPTGSRARKNITLLGYFYGQTRTKPDKTRQAAARWRSASSSATRSPTPTSRRPTTRGTSGCACSPTATCTKRSGAVAASVVTDRITTLHAERHRARVGSRARGRHRRHRDRSAAGDAGRDALRRRRRHRSTSPRRSRTAGLAFSDVPNLASTFGYINASWTMRSDLIARFVCRLLNHMRATGTDQCTPRLRESDHDMPRRPWIDGFTPGYMQRVMPRMPKQGDRRAVAQPAALQGRPRSVAQGPARRRRPAVHPRSHHRVDVNPTSA